MALAFGRVLSALVRCLFQHCCSPALRLAPVSFRFVLLLLLLFPRQQCCCSPPWILPPLPFVVASICGLPDPSQSFLLPLLLLARTSLFSSFSRFTLCVGPPPEPSSSVPPLHERDPHRRHHWVQKHRVRQKFVLNRFLVLSLVLAAGVARSLSLSPRIPPTAR